MYCVRIRVTGAVQGVGFRPFCYSQAVKHGLAGFVKNDLSGVEIALEGDRSGIEGFIEALRSKPPPASRISGIVVEEARAQGFAGFKIIASERGNASQGLEVSADLATCEECRREIFDPGDRRYGYAFTNCTDCGPRYTIIKDLPYDRPMTTMEEFRMCSDCRSEYENPLDRRFHAQPNACSVCGPDVALLDSSGRAVACRNPIEETAALIARGRIVAVKGLGGYHLVCDASSVGAIRELRLRKKRPHKALALMARDVDAARTYARISWEEERVLKSSSAPILLLEWNEQMPQELKDAIAPMSPGVGIMLAYTPLHHLLFTQTLVDPLSTAKGVVVATSANRGDEPLIADERELFERLTGVFDAALVHNRRIKNRIDDSVGFFLPLNRGLKAESQAESGIVSPSESLGFAWGDGFYLVRRARGFAPQPFRTPFEFPPMLSVGAEMKGSFALSEGSRLWLSPHVGELTNRRTIEFFEETLETYMRWFRVKPGVVVADMHPDYLSTRWAERFSQEKGIPLVGVQHHHAHIASVIFEHALTEPVIGLALDGTGYGAQPTEKQGFSMGTQAKEIDRGADADNQRNAVISSEEPSGVGSIWGCELLYVPDEGARYERLGHLLPLALAGGELAIRRPRRMAAGVVADLFGSDKAVELFGREAEIVSAQLAGGRTARVARVARGGRGGRGGLEVVRASSAGRLFDTVAGILGLVDEITYEAQAAVALEWLAVSAFEDGLGGYPFDITPERLIDPKPCLSEILADLEKGRDKSVIAARFHKGFADALVLWALKAAEEKGASTIAASGGVLANRLLQRFLGAGAQERGLRFYTTKLVPSTDGGIAVGQLQVAAKLAQLGLIKK